MTIQIEDGIEFNGAKYTIQKGLYPLELLFKDDKQVHSPMLHFLPDLPDEEKVPRPDFYALNMGTIDTSCSRGYCGIWTVHNDMLYLKDIKGLGGESFLREVFPEHVGLVEATWFTGSLDLCDGGVYVQSFFLEKKVLSLEIEKGRLVAYKENAMAQEDLEQRQKEFKQALLSYVPEFLRRDDD